jgi:hypothetical protein
MRNRALLFIPVLAAAVLGIGASGASAATLFTNTAHTTRVSVGTTATATSEGNIDRTSGATLLNRCPHSSLHLVVEENSDTRVSIGVVASTFSACTGIGAVTGVHTPPWTLTITGTGTMIGGSTAYAATVHRVTFNIVGGLYAGNLETGVTATQPTAATSPICVDLNAAGTVSGPLTGDGRIDGKYCLTSGAASAFSLTN